MTIIFATILLYEKLKLSRTNICAYVCLDALKVWVEGLLIGRFLSTNYPISCLSNGESERSLQSSVVIGRMFGFMRSMTFGKHHEPFFLFLRSMADVMDNGKRHEHFFLDFRGQWQTPCPMVNSVRSKHLFFSLFSVFSGGALGCMSWQAP